MLRSRNSVCLALLAFVMTFSANAYAQGKGKGKDHGQGGAKPHGPPGKPARDKMKVEAPKPTKSPHGNSAAAHEAHDVQKAQQKYDKAVAKSIGKANRQAAINAAHQAILSAAVARAASRGHADYYRIQPQGERYVILNRTGTPLVYLNENEARDLGRWRVGLLNDQVREGAPSFCRSGEGHPVWGRQWCIDKGFGLGDYQDYRWGRTNDLGEWNYARESYQPTLTSTVLQRLLGTTAFNRLAVQAVELGFLEPLTGRWVSQQTGPNLLMVNSGSYPVAELVDTNRDFRWDDLLVALLLNR